MDRINLDRITLFHEIGHSLGLAHESQRSTIVPKHLKNGRIRLQAIFDPIGVLEKQIRTADKQIFALDQNMQMLLRYAKHVRGSEEYMKRYDELKKAKAQIVEQRKVLEKQKVVEHNKVIEQRKVIEQLTAKKRL